MIKQLKFVAIAVAALWPATFVSAQHHHHDDHHDGHGIGIHFGGDHHDDHHGIGIHLGDVHHDDHGHHGSHHSDWHHSDWHHSDWHFVVPHFDHHYHGTYYADDGINYYVPRSLATQPGAYIAAKPIEIAFGGFSHVDDLSGRLERLANQLCLELHYNYKHNAGFPGTYREAYQILDTAKYIHVKEHQGDRAEVARRLNDVDGLFHHVQAQLAGWSRRQYRQIGQGGVQAKLQAVEATLHHLMHDVGVSGVHGQPDSVVAPEDAEVAPPPPAGVTLPPPGN